MPQIKWFFIHRIFFIINSTKFSISFSLYTGVIVSFKSSETIAITFLVSLFLFFKSLLNISILGWLSFLKPSTTITSTFCNSWINSSKLFSFSFLFSVIFAQRFEELIITWLEPASRCLKLSVPGLSISKSWWACFIDPTW